MAEKKVSYSTARKIRILTEKLGVGWQKKYPDRSIDSIYNEVVGDNRKNLFCKIDPEVKEQIDEMIVGYDVKMAELIERLIREEHVRFEQRKDQFSFDLASQFAREA